MNIAVFKYATAFGGGEKYTQLLCDGLVSSRPKRREPSLGHGERDPHVAAAPQDDIATPKQDVSVALISNYRKLITDCRADKKIYCRRLPEAKTRKEMLTLLFLWPIETINYLFIALRLRLKGYQAILLQDLNEKLLLTPICRHIGIKVFWVEHTNWQPHLVKHPFFPILRLSMRLTEKIICPSRQLAKQMNDATVVISTSRGEEKSHEISRPTGARDDAGYTRDGNKIMVVPHGVPKTVAQDKHRSTRIVAVTRLSHEKGVDLLIGAMAKLDGKPEVVIFGDGDEKANLSTVARSGGVNAVLKGHVDDPYLAISKSDIFVLPSRVENFPLSILEALSAGLVIVAPKIGGVPEILGGTDNFLFEPNDIDNLRDQIALALNLNSAQCRKLSLANQKLWQKRYNSNGMVERIISIISQPKDGPCPTAGAAPRAEKPKY